MLTTFLLTLMHTPSPISLLKRKDYCQKTRKYGEFHLLRHQLMMRQRYWFCPKLSLKDRSKFKRPNTNSAVLMIWERMLFRSKIISQFKSTKLNDTKTRRSKRSMTTRWERGSSSLANLSDLELTSLVVLQAWHSSTFLFTEDSCIQNQLLIQWSTTKHIPLSKRIKSVVRYSELTFRLWLVMVRCIHSRAMLSLTWLRMALLTKARSVLRANMIESWSSGDSTA